MSERTTPAPNAPPCNAVGLDFDAPSFDAFAPDAFAPDRLAPDRLATDGPAPVDPSAASGTPSRRPAPALVATGLVACAVALARGPGLWRLGVAAAERATELELGPLPDDFAALLGVLRGAEAPPSHAPSAQVVVAWNDAPWPATASPALLWRFGDAPRRARLEAVGEGASEAELSLWVARLHEVAARLSESPGRPLASLPAMPPAERALVLGFGAGASRPLEDGTCFDDLEHHARERPDAPAVEGPGGWLSYRTLLDRAEALAARLRALGVGPGSPVGVVLRRGPDAPLAALAVWRAGGVYVPVDPAHPAERRAWVLSDSGCEVCLVDPSTAALVGERRLAFVDPATEPLARAAAPVALGAPGTTAAPTIPSLAAPTAPTTPAAPDAPTAPVSTPVGGDDPAYVIYTSGSTGRPKGVEVSHRALRNLLRGKARLLVLGPHDCQLAVMSVAFDASIFELFLAPSAGGRVAVASAEEMTDARRLAAAIARVRPTVLGATPATWQSLLEAGWREPAPRHLLVGGDVLRPDLAAGLRPLGRVWNMYGLSETAITSLAFPVDEAPAGASVPVGWPLDNVVVRIARGPGELAPVGVEGELYLGGAGVARRYLGRPELDAVRFVDDPAGPGGGRFYRTGDRARWRADGAVEFGGRLDEQVKVRGVRVEPAESEAALRTHPGVADCAVVAVDGPQGPRLVAFVVGHADANELRALARRYVPEAAVPTTFVALDALPLSPHGKVDRPALRTLALRRDALLAISPADPPAAPSGNSPAASAAAPSADPSAGALAAPPVDPSGALAASPADPSGAPAASPADPPADPAYGATPDVARLVGTLLGGAPVPPDADFAELGLDSLSRARLRALLAEHGHDVSEAELGEHPSAARLAALLERRAADAPPPAPAPPGDDAATTGTTGGLEAARAAGATGEADRASAAGATGEADRASAAGPTGEADRPGEPLAITYNQYLPLVTTLANPGTGVWNCQYACSLRGPLDRVALRRAWQWLAEGHAALRSAYRWRGLRWPELHTTPAPGPALPWRVETLAAADPADRSGRLAALQLAELAAPFDPDAAPLWRVALVEVGPDEHELLWTYHSGLVDGWSSGVVVRRLFKAYAAFRDGRAPRLPAEPPFGAYVRRIADTDWSDAEAFFRACLAGYEPPPPLAPRPAMRPVEAADPDVRALLATREGRAPVFEGVDAKTAVLSPAARARLEACARERRASVAVVLQAAWALAVLRTVGARDTLLGMVVTNRPDFDAAVGKYTNVLPVRVRVEPGRRVGEWLAERQRLLDELRRFGAVPPPVWARALGPLHRGAFETGFTYVDYGGRAERAPLAGGLVVADSRQLDRGMPPVLGAVAIAGPRLALRLERNLACGLDDARFEAIFEAFLRSLGALLRARPDDPLEPLVAGPFDAEALETEAPAPVRGAGVALPMLD